MSSLSTLPKGDSAWLLRKSIQRIMQQVSVLETNIGSSTTGNSADTQVIFNDAGTLRGDTGLTYDKSADRLSFGAGICYGLLTSASATITGALTVNGISNFSGAFAGNYGLTINNTTNNAAGYLKISGTGTGGGGEIDFYNGATAWGGIKCTSSSQLEFLSNAFSTLMTLNATGLGVGITSPSYRLEVRDTADAVIALVKTGANSLRFLSTSSGGVINQVDNNPLAFYTNNTERARIDSSGNFGLGVTPSAWGTGFKALEFANSSFFVNALVAGNPNVAANFYYNTSAQPIYKSNGFASAYSQYNGAHSWATAPSGTAGNVITFNTAMTLDASGNLLVGTPSQNGSWNTKLTLSNDSGTTKWAVGPYLGGVTNFLISAGAAAGVYLNGTAATSWTSASDERLKDIIEPISNAIAKVGSLRAVIGKFKFDENNTRKPFLIAQDIQAVLPEAVDASNPEKLGVAYTDVIPLLVAAIKELTARVQTLETR